LVQFKVNLGAGLQAEPIDQMGVRSIA